jgi:O-antigen/teichoic acid export membrane protein
VIKSLYQWISVNSIILVNAGSLVGTSAITSVLGFVYWWFAARQFSPQAVGLASATIAAMTLLGSLSMFGLGTLLIGELPRQQGKEASLISSALIVVGVIGICIGAVFAAAAPYLSSDFQILRANIGSVAIFALGVSLTSITLVFDQALIGLLRGELQLWRNMLFALVKLIVLFAVSLVISKTTGLAIYATWAVGNALSLVAIGAFAILKGEWSGRIYLPQLKVLRKLGPQALKHHLLNLTLQAPSLLLPVLVTILLSATANAWFYISWSIASIANFISVALTTVLYAASSAQPSTLARKLRLTLSLALVATILANCIYFFDTQQVLGLFGHSYAEQATWSLRILGLESFPFIIKNHYVTVCRIQGRIVHALLPTIAGGILELSASVIGAYLGGLSGLSIGWFAAVCVEAVFMSRTVYKIARAKDTPQELTQQESVEVEPIWLIDTFVQVSIGEIYRQRKQDRYTNARQRDRTNGHNSRGKPGLRPISLQRITVDDNHTDKDESAWNKLHFRQ